MSLTVQVRYDRVGEVYRAGETVSGVVAIESSSSTSYSSITLVAEGVVALFSSVRGLGAFESFFSSVNPHVMLALEIPISQGGKLPEGEIEIPFEFKLEPIHPKYPLLETYQGVYVCSTYQCTATVHRMIGKKVSEPAVMNVYCPGQGVPLKSLLAKDQGVPFTLGSDNMKAVKRFNGPRIPQFLIDGLIDRVYNDIDVPLSGWVCVRQCDVRITSIELQFIRVESCATATNHGREATEIQNIQIGDGEVMRGLQIPIYMFFPRWYTCPTLRTTNLKVEFEVNLVVTLEEQNQVTQNLPIKLYRAKNC